MLVRGATGGEAPTIKAVGGFGRRAGPGATALKGDLAEPAPLTMGGVGFAPGKRGRRTARRSADEGLCRRGLPGVRELHHGAERHVPEVRHVRGDDGVLVR